MVLRFALSFPEDIDDVSSDMTRYYAGVFVFLMGYRLQYGLYYCLWQTNIRMVFPARFELATHGLENRRSIRLSYGNIR